MTFVYVDIISSLLYLEHDVLDKITSTHVIGIKKKLTSTKSVRHSSKTHIEDNGLSTFRLLHWGLFIILGF